MTATTAAPIRIPGPSCIVTNGSEEMFQRLAASGSEAVARISTTAAVRSANPSSGSPALRSRGPRAMMARPIATSGGATISVYRP